MSDAPMTAEAATTERQTLMADAGWRAQAMDPASAQWARLTELNAVIAEAMQPALEPEAVVPEGPDPQPDVDIPEGAFAAPERPQDYMLPTDYAKSHGLHVDEQAEYDLRHALHGAGVDNAMASMLYQVAAHAQTQELTPISHADAYMKAEGELRQLWGRELESRLRLANDEGRRVFDALPPSVKQGMDYAEWAVVTGLSTSRQACELLYQRAKARQS